MRKGERKRNRGRERGRGKERNVRIAIKNAQTNIRIRLMRHLWKHISPNIHSINKSLKSSDVVSHIFFISLDTLKNETSNVTCSIDLDKSKTYLHGDTLFLCKSALFCVIYARTQNYI